MKLAILDFAADAPFAKAGEKLRKHGGVSLSTSTIRTITETHAHGGAVYHQGDPAWPSERGASTVIAEIMASGSQHWSCSGDLKQAA